MKEFFDQVVFNNPLKNWGITLGVVVVFFLLRHFFSTTIAIGLYKMFTRKKNPKTLKAFVKHILPATERLVLFLITITVFAQLEAPRFFYHKIELGKTMRVANVIHGATIVIIIFMIFQLLLRVVRFIVTAINVNALGNTQAKVKRNAQFVNFIGDITKVVLYIIAILLVLHYIFHQNISGLITGLSIITAAIAFATKESLENLIASFIILIDKPYTIGDTVRMNTFQGKVEKIGLRSTRVRTPDKTYISIPNKQMADNIVDNVSRRTQRKVELRLELELGANATQIKKIITAIKKLIAQQNYVEESKVYFTDTGKTAHIILVEYFLSKDTSDIDFNEIRQNINLGVVELLQKEQLTFASGYLSIEVDNHNN